jgi:hypothetical protein
MVTTTMKQPVYSKTTTKEVTQGSTTSIIPQTRVIELKTSIKPTTFADSIVGPLVVVVLGCSLVVVPFLTCCLVSSIVSVLTESVGVVVVANLVV